MKQWSFLLITLFLLGCERPEPEQPTPDAAGWELGPFTKHANNPIIMPRGDTWEAKDVFNPAAWTDGETVYMIYRAEDSTGIGDWNGTSRLGLATSTDGLNFERQPDPIFEPEEAWELPGGVEDPRIVQVEGRYYLTYTGYDGEVARLGLASSDDLTDWTRHGVLFPEWGWTKSGAIFPERINGSYWMYFGDTNIWAAHSEDMIHWTPIQEPVMTIRENMFDERLIEPGPPLFRTDQGLLMLYNSADSNLVYRAAQALFDPEDPMRVLKRSSEPFMTPETMLEQTGQIANVVFIEGLVFFKGTWYLYYGMGDSGIGVATYTP